ncbi:DUF1016 family protein [Burkholderia sp. Bp8963]|nr:DUF1016 family protein [Burkholderia sp. Bp8963]
MASRYIQHVVESTRAAAARSVNALMTATYWEVGRRIVEFEQGGEGRATYGEAVTRMTESGSSGALLRRRPLRTVRASFPAYGSSLYKASC